MQTRAQVEALVVAGHLDELKTRLCSRMSFGTAGLRAPMGAGFSRINDLTVIQSTQVRHSKHISYTSTVRQNTSAASMNNTGQTKNSFPLCRVCVRTCSGISQISPVEEWLLVLTPEDRRRVVAAASGKNEIFCNTTEFVNIFECGVDMGTSESYLIATQ